MKLFDYVERIILYILGSLFIVVFSVNMTEIIYRAVAGKSIIWVVDFTQMLFIWMMMLGATVAMYRGEHVLVEMSTDKWPHKLENTLKLIIKLMILAFYVVLLIKGYKVAQLRMGINYVMLGWPTGYSYAALPVSAVLMIFFLMPSFWTTIMRFRYPDYNKIVHNDDEEVLEVAEVK